MYWYHIKRCVSSSGGGFVHVEPDPDELAVSAVGNEYGFHGRPVDRGTGFVYVRNRYFDPELARFISTDPLTYVDGPSTYSYGGNSPYNSSDPLGLYLTGGPREAAVIKQILHNVGLADEARRISLQKGTPFGHPNETIIWLLDENGRAMTLAAIEELVDHENEIGHLILSAIATQVQIRFKLSGVENRGNGGVTKGRGLFGIPIFDPDRDDSENRILIDINPVQISRLTVRGSEEGAPWVEGTGGVREGMRYKEPVFITVPLEAAVVHELGHAYFMYWLRNQAPFSDREETNEYAVEWENKYRRLVGLTERLWHD